MGKILHIVFKTVVNNILQVLPFFGESGSEFSYFIPEPRNFAEVTRLSEYINKPWLKATLEEIKILINKQTFLVHDPDEGEPVTPCMDVYKEKIQSCGNLDKLKLRIVVRGDLQHKELFGGESGSEFSYFIPEPRNFAEVTRLSEYINKPWLKATLEEIKILINKQTFLVHDPDEGEPVTPCMDVYKEKIQSCGNLDKLKLRIVVRGDLQHKELFGDTWSPTASMRNLKYF